MPPQQLQRGTKEIELRSSADVRVTEHVDGFSGYASTWWVADSYGTAMAPGSFKKSIRERGDRIPVLWNHNPNAPVGKHLAIREDGKGLFVDVGISDDGAEGSTLLKRLRFGVPLGMSFGFRNIKSRAATDDDPIDLSLLPGARKSEIEVYTENAYWESSPVTFPANSLAGIEKVRSIEEHAAISTLLEDLRSGQLVDGDERWALLHDLVAAFTERQQPEPDHTDDATPLAEEDARRIRTEALNVSLAALGMSVESIQASAA